MADLKLWYTSSLLSCTLSKTPSVLYPLTATPLISSSFPVLRTLSSLDLSGFYKSSSFSSRTACNCTSATGDSGFSEKYGDAEGEDSEVFDDEFEDEDYSIDVEAFEEEAKDVLREYSSSLSRELRLGACVHWCIRFCVSSIFVIVKERGVDAYVR